MPTPVTIRCLCGKIDERAELKSPELPAEVGMCHCSTCRHMTGMVGVSWLHLTSKVTDKSNLATYEVSSATSRYFCKTCGSHCFTHTPQDDCWYAASGLIDRIEVASSGEAKDIIKVNSHYFVDATGDGGIVGRLTKIGGRDVTCYAGDPRTDPEPMKQLPQSPVSNTPSKAITSAGEKLRISCHCNGVEFFLLRPKKRGLDREDFWLKGEDTKYVAKICVCESCRRGSGFPLQPWMYTARSEIVAKDGSPFDFTSGTLQAFESSSGVFRHFCGRCGATVFYRSDKRTARLGYDFIDISIGLLRDDEGVRAENWLEWDFEDIICQEEAIDKELVDAIVSGP